MKIAQPIINEITQESSALLIFRGALKRLVTTLEKNPRYANSQIAVLPSSITINDSIIAAMSSNISNRLLRASQVDRRDGFNLEILDADILIATSADSDDSVHLGAEHRRVMTLPSQALFDTSTPIGEIFVMDRVLSFPLADGNTAHIFQRIQVAPFRNGVMAAWMERKLHQFYPNVRINNRKIVVS